jgi:hypothetical protein
MIPLAMDITITDEEASFIDPVILYIGTSGALFNDLSSWHKECYEFALDPTNNLLPTNAVLVIMNEYSVSVNEAKIILMEKIIAYEAKYFAAKQNLEEAHPYLRKTVKDYLFVVEMMIGGAHIWHTSSTRYNRAIINDSAPESVTATVHAFTAAKRREQQLRPLMSNSLDRSDESLTVVDHVAVKDGVIIRPNQLKSVASVGVVGFNMKSYVQNRLKIKDESVCLTILIGS